MTATAEPLAVLVDPTRRDSDKPTLSFRTGLLRTRVDRLAPGCYRWTREPGALAPEPFQGSRSTTGLREVHPALCPAEPDGTARRYRTRGATTAATLLLRREDTASLGPVLGVVGQALTALHATTVTPDPASPSASPGPLSTGALAGAVPRGLRRYDRWVAGRAGTPAAACALDVAVREMGTKRWERLAAWRSDLAGEDVVLSHGAPGLGSVVLGADGEVDLLTGEDLCLAPRSFDTGWLLGELIELRLALGGDGAAWNELTAALTAGTGTGLSPAWHLAAAFRILLHLHDYTAYVAWEEPLIAHYARFVSFLLDLEPDLTR
ncbi:hypothetical protein [Kineococcus arenarius]|uniref:hypothetical protein n=1 Tax=unclassified Kineococcus TaxID=2621656 RepID=UPI003D7C8478